MLINNQCIILLITSGIWVLRSKSTVTVTERSLNQRMLKIINFSDGYKVTTDAFSMLLTVCWNRLTVWWIRLTVWQNRLTVWWNRLTLTNGLLTADWRWLTANWRFRPLNVKTLVYVFPCEVTYIRAVFKIEKPKSKQWQSQSQGQANFHFQPTTNHRNLWSNLLAFTNQVVKTNHIGYFEIEVAWHQAIARLVFYHGQLDCE